ncbi:MAG TPA: sulfotransferase [Candidatus Dormibacteraeota bacterium]|jgi:hypothetical protein|nr:sulfotransferase [Candidatus Dormibacteraeota bacterium]
MNRILVVGAPRSGTTWLAATLAATPRAALMHEPDNPFFQPEASTSLALYGGYPVLHRRERAPEYQRLWDDGFRQARARVLDPDAEPPWYALRKRGLRPKAVIAKSVYAAFAMDWLVDRYSPRVVLIERHPIDVVCSWMRLGFVVGDLATRDRVRTEHVEPFRLPRWHESLPRLLQVSWAVGVLMSALRRQARARPDWTVISYEALASDRSLLRSLALSLGLSWSDRAAAWAQTQDGAGVYTGSERVEAREYLLQFPELAPSLATPVAV